MLVFIILSLVDYSVFRTDRCSDNSSFLHGVGVFLIAIHNTFSSRIMEVINMSVEYLFVDVRLGHDHLVVGAIYFPPGSDVFVYESHCHAIEENVKSF